MPNNALPILLLTAVLSAPAILAQAPNLDAMDIVLKSVPDGPVARVNGVSVAKYDFVRLYQSELERSMKENGSTNIPDGARVKLGMWCLGNLIQQELLHQEALKRKFEIDRETTEKTWDAQLEQFKQRFGETEGAPATEANILKQMGYSEREDMLVEIERILLIEKTRIAIVAESGPEISDERIAEIYEQQKGQFTRPETIHIRQIYIGDTNEGSTDPSQMALSPRQRAERTLGLILAGQRFETVAKEHSQGRGREQGGDLGPLPATQLPPFLAATAQTMEVGEISDIIESEYGLHIIQLVSIDSARTGSLDDAAPAIRRTLMAQAGVQLIRDYCDHLLQEGADVNVFLELERNLSLNPEYRQMQLN